MKIPWLFCFVPACALLLGVGFLLTTGTAHATHYGSLSGGVPGGVGPVLALPSVVPGKEYSQNFDAEELGGPMPEQVIAWDGSGGADDGLNYVGNRPDFTTIGEVDAIANRRDHLYPQLIGDPNAPGPTDEAHLIFSVDDVYTGYSGGVPFLGSVSAVGPISLPIGTIGGSGELSYELAGAFAPPSSVGIWATQAEVNSSLPRDVDGVEVWGPEPGFTGDADKYSLDDDFASFDMVVPGDAVSVWNYSTAGMGSPYILHSTIVSAVSGLLDLPTAVDPGQINLDALMVQDVAGDLDKFDRDPTGGEDHDSIIFSIRQIPGGPDGYFATGSELFVLDGAGGVSFLEHGGHVWDKTYALAAFDILWDDQDNFGVLDINAIEAISQSVIPEPASVLLMLIGLVGLGRLARRRRSL